MTYENSVRYWYWQLIAQSPMVIKVTTCVLEPGMPCYHCADKHLVAPVAQQTRRPSIMIRVRMYGALRVCDAQQPVYSNGCLSAACGVFVISVFSVNFYSSPSRLFSCRHIPPNVCYAFVLKFSCPFLRIDGPPKDDVLVPPVAAFGVISAFAVLATALSLFFVCFSVWHRKKK